MNKLAATTLESKFHVFDMRTQHPTKGFASLAEKVMSNAIFANHIFYHITLIRYIAINRAKLVKATKWLNETNRVFSSSPHY